jgi:alkaline phosphatase D
MLLDLRPYELPPIFQAIYYFTVDQWDGFRTERREILEALAGTPNVVALTGDIHAFYAAEIHVDPDDLTDEPVLVEFVTAGISSSPVQEIAATVVAGDPAFEPLADLVPQFDTVLQATSPEYKYASSNAHGVAIVEVDAEELTVEFLELADVKSSEWDGALTRTKLKTITGSNRVTSV